MAEFLGVSKATITNYALPKKNKRKISPRPEKADRIIEFALSKRRIITLEDIYGDERANALRKLGKAK